MTFIEGCVLSSEVKSGDIYSLREEEITYIQPCSSEKGKITADIMLSHGKRFFDTSKLCLITKSYNPMFAEERCSQKLGVALIRWRGREISILPNGRITIRRGFDEDDISRTLNFILRLLWGSILCRECGEPAMNCASGRCEKCSLEESLNFDDGLKLMTWLKEILGGEFLINGLENIKNASENIISSVKEDTFWEGPPIATKQIKRKINESIRNSLIYLVETPGMNNALLGLASVGLAANLNDSFRYITELGVKFPNQLLKVRKLAESSMSLVAKAMNIIDFPKLATLYKEYQKLENEYKCLKNGKHDLHYCSLFDEILIMMKSSLRMNRITKSIFARVIIGNR